jgi:signal transduction histidine kinase
MAARAVTTDSVSHDLRTPLNGIKMWAQVLETAFDSGDDATVRRALDGIMTAIDQQAALLDNLIDVRRAGHSIAASGSNSGHPEEIMADTKRNPNEQQQDRNRSAEHPQRPDPEPDTMEGPGGRGEAKAEQDAKNKTTRRGER